MTVSLHIMCVIEFCDGDIFLIPLALASIHFSLVCIGSQFVCDDFSGVSFIFFFLYLLLLLHFFGIFGILRISAMASATRHTRRHQPSNMWHGIPISTRKSKRIEWKFCRKYSWHIWGTKTTGTGNDKRAYRRKGMNAERIMLSVSVPSVNNARLVNGMRMTRRCILSFRCWCRYPLSFFVFPFCVNNMQIMYVVRLFFCRS